MSKRHRHNRPIQTQAAFDLTNFLSRPWVPIVFFALLTAGYFYHLLITGDVIYGSDTGAEFHRGNEPFAEALKKLPQKNWSRYMGGMPESAALRAQYYPLKIIDLFTSEHRYFGWRYIFAMFTAGYFMYLCTRSFGLHPLAALIAGAAYTSAPAFLSFSQAGHYAKNDRHRPLPPHVLGTQSRHGHAAHHLLFNPRRHRRHRHLQPAPPNGLLCPLGTGLALSIQTYTGSVPQWNKNRPLSNPPIGRRDLLGPRHRCRRRHSPILEHNNIVKTCGFRATNRRRLRICLILVASPRRNIRPRHPRICRL